MATANFQARIQRINHANSDEMGGKNSPLRMERATPTPGGHASAEATAKLKKSMRARPRSAFLPPMIFGGAFGAAMGWTLMASNDATTVLGPGTPFHEYAIAAGLGGLAAAPLMMLLALLKGAKKPRLSVLALAYLTGLIAMLLI